MVLRNSSMASCPTRHFVLVPEKRKMPSRVRLGTRVVPSTTTLSYVRRLLVVTFLLLSASDARRAVAERSRPYRRVEVRVEDFSFSDGPKETQEIAIEARDIKGSELEPWPDGDIHVLTWETTDKTSNEEVKMEKEVKTKLPAVAEDEEIEDFAVRAAIAKVKEDETLKRYVSYRTAVWWWNEEKTELTTQEQTAVLAVVVAMLVGFGLVFTLLWNVGWIMWRVYCERRTLRKFFNEDDPTKLEQAISTFPAKLLSLKIKQIACVRLRHLQVVCNARDLKQQLEAVTFDQSRMELRNLPLHPTTKKDMTFAEIMTRVEEIACRGEQVAVEMMQLAVPIRWKSYVNEELWLQAQDESLQSLHLENARIQQISEQLSDLIVTKMNSSDALPKSVFLVLLASLRPTSGTPPQNAINGSATSSELDAFARCWSGSMTMSGSVGNIGGGQKEKDEFSFLVKAFEEKAEQQRIQQELQSAIESFQSAHEPEHEQLLLLENTDASSHNQLVQRTNRLGATTAASSISTAASMRRLERWVDQAEAMEMTYVDEVESAQFMLEDARRDSFCAAIVSNEGKGLDSVQTLATNFVALGAKREDAILKAGEILANRSNMMLLVNSLRSMFDQLRKRDIMKMNERRNRDRFKAQNKSDRLAQKFLNKQRLIAEKIDRTREAQRQREEELRLQRRIEELNESRAQGMKDRSLFVWKMTKVDVFVVLVIMAIVFFENVREVAFVKPLCQPDEAHHWWMVSWWAPTSMQVFGCEVAYGIKVLGLLVALGVVFFVVAQLNLVAVLLPVIGGIVLYFVRAEWMNMLFRLPLLLVIYGFNMGVLYLFNHFEDHGKDDLSIKGGSNVAVLHATKWRRILLYVVFPLCSLLLTVATGIGIACDAPNQCVVSAYTAMLPVIAGLWELARGAYGL